MKYITATEAAIKWNITERRVLSLCNSGRINGAAKHGWSWAIPANAVKPIDKRRKNTPHPEEFFDENIIIERIWAMPNSRTFEIKPIKELILDEITNGVWIDPFANQSKLAQITNDLNPDFDTDYHMDALDFLKMFDNCSIDGVLYDPPYSPRQVSECYNDVGYNVTWDTTKASFWGNHKREISRIVKPNGKVITFGWNSGGIGMKYGFEIKRILIVPHGGWYNDTICTVETKTKQPLSINAVSFDTDSATGCNKEENAKDNALIEKLCSLPDGFWDFKNADTRELTHGLHNYPAVMVYPISRNIIKIINSIAPPNTLLDPFAGSGTVLVEGIIGGINKIYGNDLNPLARLMCEVKTTPIKRKCLETAYNNLMMAIEYDLTCINSDSKTADYYISVERGLDISAKDGWAVNAPEYLKEYLLQKGVELAVPDFKNIGYWYRPQVIIDLQIIKNCISELPISLEKRFFWLAFSELTRIVSNRRNGEFKMFRMPVDKVLSYIPDVKREFDEILRRNIDKMSDFAERCEKNGYSHNVNIFSENSLNLSGVLNNSIDLMITSPPYGDSRTTVAYGEFSKLSLQWLDLDDISIKAISNIDKNLMGGKKYRNGFEYTLDSETLRCSLEKIKDSDIERAGDVFSFYHDLDGAIATISKKMKQGGYQFWVVGNRTVKLETLQTDKILVELSSKYGLVHVHTIDRNILNKSMPTKNSPTNETGKKAATMTNEHIVVLRKR